MFAALSKSQRKSSSSSSSAEAERGRTKRLIVPTHAISGEYDQWVPKQPKYVHHGTVDVNVLFFDLSSPDDLTPAWVAENELNFSVALAKCATHNLMKKLYGNMSRNNVENVRPKRNK